jgi:hypothetical protein
MRAMNEAKSHTKVNNLKLRNIVVPTISGIIILLLFGIAISFIWPEYWNSALSMLILNIIASLIGVLIGILVAIFIVERYLEQHRREVAEKEAFQETMYREQWQAYLNGGLAMLSALITHLSLFVAYGQKEYLELLNARGDTSKVPETIGEFIPFLMDSMENRRQKRREGNLKDDDQSKGMGEEDAIRLAKAFSEIKSSELYCSLKDLNSLLHYLRGLRELLRDQIFLFQPFMVKRMGLGVTLLQLSRNLADAIEDIQFLLINQKPEKTVASVHLDGRITIKYCWLGKQAVKVIQLIWNYAKGTDDDFKVVGTDYKLTGTHKETH